MTKSNQRIFMWLLAIGLANLLQSFFMPLHFDEAYYVLFSRHLDWGFFDHPPMMALWMAIGGFLGDHPVCWRLVYAIANPLMFGMIWSLFHRTTHIAKENSVIEVSDLEPDPRRVDLFFMLALSLPMLQMVGFVATPDAPLMFFSVLFMIVFLRFSEKSTMMNTLLLGVSMALLAYSKYHGAVLVLAAALSNWKLFANYRFYLAGVLTLVLIAPHLWWQYNHDWVSIDYHLFDRSSAFSWENPIGIVGSIIGVFNPFLIYFFVKGVKDLPRPLNRTHRLMLYTFWAFIIFPIISSFKGHAQVQWSIIGLIGYLYVVYHYVNQEEQSWKSVRWITVVTLVLFVTLRVVLLFMPSLQHKFGFRSPDKYSEIRQQIGDRPLLYCADYAEASLYAVNSGGEGFSLSDLGLRSSQFQFWDFDKEYLHKEVAFVTPEGSHQVALKDGDALPYTIIKNYVPSHCLQAEFMENIFTRVTAYTEIKGTIKLTNPYDFDFPLQDGVTELMLTFGQRRKYILPQPVFADKMFVPARGSVILPYSYMFPSEMPEGRLAFCVVRPPLPPFYAGRSGTIQILPAQN